MEKQLNKTLVTEGSIQGGCGGLPIIPAEGKEMPGGERGSWDVSNPDLVLACPGSGGPKGGLHQNPTEQGHRQAP